MVRICEIVTVVVRLTAARRGAAGVVLPMKTPDCLNRSRQKSRVKPVLDQAWESASSPYRGKFESSPLEANRNGTGALQS